MMQGQVKPEDLPVKSKPILIYRLVGAIHLLPFLGQHVSQINFPVFKDHVYAPIILNSSIFITYGATHDFMEQSFICHLIPKESVRDLVDEEIKNRCQAYKIWILMRRKKNINIKDLFFWHRRFIVFYNVISKHICTTTRYRV
jgi:hypothetical protein